MLEPSSRYRFDLHGVGYKNSKKTPAGAEIDAPASSFPSRLTRPSPDRRWVDLLFHGQVSVPAGHAHIGASCQDSSRYNSMTRATSPWHSAHLPTSNSSPSLMVPLKFVIVVSWRQCPHQTLANSRWQTAVGGQRQVWIPTVCVRVE